MKRTDRVEGQEIRKMPFEEAYGVWTEGRLSQEEAARILGVSSRTFRRYTGRYEENGLEGLVSGLDTLSPDTLSPQKISKLSFHKDAFEQEKTYRCRTTALEMLKNETGGRFKNSGDNSP